MSDLKGSAITWLGHATVHIATQKGTSILIDPFIEKNPKYPRDYKLPGKIDLVLLTHGHSDHIADAVPVAKKYDSTVVSMVELSKWVGSQGIEKSVGMNLGGSYTFEDVVVSMVEAKHSTGIDDGDRVLYGGVAAGFVIEIANGPVLYHAGDTCAFSNMQTIRDLHAPEYAMLPIGDHYTMGPKGAALSAKYLGAKKILPIHYGTFPVLTGTPEKLEEHLKGSGIEVVKWTPGVAIQ